MNNLMHSRKQKKHQIFLYRVGQKNIFMSSRRADSPARVLSEAKNLFLVDSEFSGNKYNLLCQNLGVL